MAAETPSEAQEPEPNVQDHVTMREEGYFLLIQLPLFAKIPMGLKKKFESSTLQTIR